MLPPEIVTAINKFDSTLRNAVRKDSLAEADETWDSKRLKACEVAWAQHHAARVELEAAIIQCLERS